MSSSHTFYAIHHFYAAELTASHVNESITTSSSVPKPGEN